MTPEQVESMQPHVIELLAAVRAADLVRVEAVYRTLEKRYSVADGAHAAAMLLADVVLRERVEARAMLTRANQESAQFAQAFMDAKSRLVEWKEINAQQADRIRQLRERLKDDAAIAA